MSLINSYTKRSQLTHSPIFKQNGFGLIEILVSVLLLGIGAVGLASMQIKAKHMTYEGIQRSIATSLARDIVERMRSNPGALANYVVSNSGANNNSTTPTPNCTTTTCNASQLAAYDLWEWEKALLGANESTQNGNDITYVGGLSEPRACITHNAGEIAVTIVWKGFDEQSNPNSVSNCGEGLGLYGNNESARQLIHISTFIEEA